MFVIISKHLDVKNALSVAHYLKAVRVLGNAKRNTFSHVSKKCKRLKNNENIIYHFWFTLMAIWQIVIIVSLQRFLTLHRQYIVFTMWMWVCFYLICSPLEKKMATLYCNNEQTITIFITRTCNNERTKYNKNNIYDSEKLPKPHPCMGNTTVCSSTSFCSIKKI